MSLGNLAKSDNCHQTLLALIPLNLFTFKKFLKHTSKSMRLTFLVLFKRNLKIWITSSTTLLNTLFRISFSPSPTRNK